MVVIVNYRLIASQQDFQIAERLSKRGLAVKVAPASDAPDLIFPGRLQKQVCVVQESDLFLEMQSHTFVRVTSKVMQRDIGSYIICVTDAASFRKVRDMISQSCPPVTVIRAVDEFELITILCEIGQLNPASTHPTELLDLQATPLQQQSPSWEDLIDRLGITDESAYQAVSARLRRFSSPLAFAREISACSNDLEISRKLGLPKMESVKLWHLFNA